MISNSPPCFQNKATDYVFSLSIDRNDDVMLSIYPPEDLHNFCIYRWPLGSRDEAVSLLLKAAASIMAHKGEAK